MSIAGTDHVSQTTSSQQSASNNWARFLPFAFIAVLFGMSFLPRMAESTRLVYSFWTASALLLGWGIFLFAKTENRKDRFVVSPKIVRVHWVQALVHSSLYAYWGYYWREVYHFIPLLVAQVVFSYAFIAFLSFPEKGLALGLWTFSHYL